MEANTTYTNIEDGLEAIVSTSLNLKNPWKVVARDTDAGEALLTKFGPTEAWAKGVAEAFVTGKAAA